MQLKQPGGMQAMTYVPHQENQSLCNVHNPGVLLSPLGASRSANTHSMV